MDTIIRSRFSTEQGACISHSTPFVYQGKNATHTLPAPIGLGIVGYPSGAGNFAIPTRPYIELLLLLAIQIPQNFVLQEENIHHHRTSIRI